MVRVADWALLALSILWASELWAETATPFPVVGGIAKVGVKTTQRVPETKRRVARFVFPRYADLPVLGADVTGAGPRLLRRLYASGKAAGNRGDLYDNRDKGHSRLPRADHPQLARTSYTDAAREAGLHYGLADRMLYEPPTIGNASLAVADGPFWRSLPRAALTEEGGARRQAQDYAAGQIYVYPEHRDHDEEHGDLFPANTPYYLISQGSSGSDQPHVQALAMILAAFRPATKRRLVETGLVAPTVQMVFRRGLRRVRSRAAYLSGLAHPSVFPSDQIALARMVGLAHAIEPDAIPPMVRLEVVSETPADEGVDYFGRGLDETLFDTSSAIARVWRSKAYSRSMVVSAAATRDPNGRELDFTWSLLRGDRDHVRIEELTPDGRRARITVQWQNPAPVPGERRVMSSRVDVGVFANNGAHDSAPAFISYLLPHHETRRYERGPRGKMRIAEIDRSRRDGIYADPVLFPRMPWRDVYHYDATGDLTGWTRERAGTRTRYDASGRRLGGEGADASATGQPVTYEIGPAPDGTPRVEVRRRAETPELP